MGDINLRIANSGMETTKAQVSIAMHNIANAGTPDFTEKTVILKSNVSSNAPNGVTIEEIASKADQFLESKMLEVNAESAMAEIIAGYYKELQDTLAKPDAQTGIIQALTQFFNGVDEMGLDPSNPSTRIRMVGAAQDLADNIKDIAYFIESKRFEADQQIHDGITNINSYLRELRQLGSALLSQTKGSIAYAQTEDSIRAKLRLLSEYMPVRSYFDKDGILNVKAKDGDYQLVGRSVFQLEYAPAPNIDTFVKNYGVNSIYINMYEDNGRLKQKVPMVYGGKSESVTHYLSGGKLAGLLHIRDTYFPAILDNINQIATNIASSVNRVHNKGVGAMPTTQLTSEVPSSLGARVAASGSMMLSVVDGEGNPIPSSSGRDYIPALQLDLSKLRIEDGPGKFNMQALISEINQHFQNASTGTRVSLNGFYDIKLGVVQGSATGNLDLDFDAWAYSEGKDINNIELAVQAIRAKDATNTPVGVSDNKGLPISFPKDYFFKNGEHVRTYGQDQFALRLNSLVSTGYPYKVEVDLKTIINGKSDTVTLTYEIAQPSSVELASINGIINKRFSATNITNDSSGTAHIVNASRSSSILSANMVDAKGNQVTNPNDKGFLQLSTKDGARIVLDQRNSNITAVDYNQKPIVGKGFSESFGMNNLFTTLNSNNGDFYHAINMAVRNDIILDPNHISMNKAEEYRVGILYGSTPALYYSVGVGGTELVDEFQALGTRPMHFNKTKDIPETDITLKDYAIQVVGVHNNATISQDEASSSLNNILQGINSQIDSKTAVNLDNQLSLIMFLQTLYTASAKGVVTTRELFKQMLEVF